MEACYIDAACRDFDYNENTKACRFSKPNAGNSTQVDTVRFQQLEMIPASVLGACETNDCKNGATCVADASLSRGYRCKCMYVFYISVFIDM